MNTFQKRHSHPNTLAAILLGIILIVLSGCKYMLKEDTATEFLNSKTFKNEKDEKLYFLRQDDQVIQLRGLSFNMDQFSAQIVQEGQAKEHMYPVMFKNNKRVNMSETPKEVVDYIYLNIIADLSHYTHGDSVRFHYNDVESVDWIEKRMDGGALIATGVTYAAVCGIFALADGGGSSSPPSRKPSNQPSTSSSCPYVYTQNGNAFIFEGEMYSGSVFKNLERHDYLPLIRIPDNVDTCTIRIQNEQDEVEYTDVVRLMAVAHPVHEKVLVDQYGNPATVANELRPASAQTSMWNNILDKISSQDKSYYAFNELDADEQSLFLTFDTRNLANDPYLIISGKNSQFAEAVVESYYSMFGNKFNTWRKRASRKSPAERLQVIRDSGLPLSVYIRKDDQWQFIDAVRMFGPKSEREMLVRLPEGAANGDQVEIKLACAFHFWELNKVSLGIPGKAQLNTTCLSPIGMEPDLPGASRLLGDEDNAYFIMNKGDHITLNFALPGKKEGVRQTLFLHAKGYYVPIHQLERKPEIAQLKRFSNPKYFSRYSREKYLQLLWPFKIQATD